MKLVILGGTGSGKGTQAAKISNNFAIPSIYIGEVLICQSSNSISIELTCYLLSCFNWMLWLVL